MNKRIIYTQDNGVVAVVVPTKDIEKTIERAVLPYTDSYEIIDKSEIPTDRTFRNAWKKDGKKIKTDMPRARNIHLNNIRKKRDKRLKEKDIEWQIAMEKGLTDKAQAIATEKQTLRDIPQTFDLDQYTEPDALKDACPDELK